MKTSLIFLCKYILPHTCVRLILLKKITCGISSHSGVAAAAVGGVSLLPGCQTAVFGIGETDSHNTPPPPQKTPQNLNFATFFRRRRRNREMQSRTPPPSHPPPPMLNRPKGGQNGTESKTAATIFQPVAAATGRRWAESEKPGSRQNGRKIRQPDGTREPPRQRGKGGRLPSTETTAAVIPKIYLQPVAAATGRRWADGAQFFVAFCRQA